LSRPPVAELARRTDRVGGVEGARGDRTGGSGSGQDGSPGRAEPSGRSALLCAIVRPSDNMYYVRLTGPRRRHVASRGRVLSSRRACGISVPEPTGPAAGSRSAHSPAHAAGSFTSGAASPVGVAPGRSQPYPEAAVSVVGGFTMGQAAWIGREQSADRWLASARSHSACRGPLLGCGFFALEWRIRAEDRHKAR
jgi:hypothetical protein